MECSCCGEVPDTSMVSSLQCHDEIKICRICAQWLMGRTGCIDVTPTLPVADMAKTVEFWEAAGFDVNRYDDGFAFVSFDEQSVFDLDLVEGFDPAANCAGCYIITDQTEAWHARFSAAGMAVSSIGDTPWGMREFAVIDPNGNRIRIGRSTPDSDHLGRDPDQGRRAAAQSRRSLTQMTGPERRLRKLRDDNVGAATTVSLAVSPSHGSSSP